MNAKKIRVLIVDDILETRENVRKLLEFEEDLEIVGAARTGKEAVQLSLQLNPDVILMDINMPDMDGITATEIIRAKNPRIQVVVLSVQADQNYMRRAMLAGARDYLTKPPLGDELVSAIRRAGEVAEEEARIQLQIKELELLTFDLKTRQDLYNEYTIAGRLVDEIEVLIAGLAHDLRSPISIILSILSTIKTEDPVTISFLKRLWRSCVYCKWIADTFLGISLSEKVTPVETGVRKYVNDLISLLEDRIPPAIEITNDVDESLLACFDVNILNLALQNLLINSMESMTGSGKIIIGSEISRRNALLTIEDNGTEISPRIADGMFQLGLTTKPFHAGIGLYVSRRLLQLQSGDLIFARDFGSKVKAFGILLPNQYPRAEKFSKARLKHLLNYREVLQKELTRLRNQGFTEEEEKQKSEQFSKITSSFSKKLSSELSRMEETVLKIMQGLPASQEDLKKSFKKIIENCAYCRLLTNNIFEIGEGAAPSFGKVSLIQTVEYILGLVDRKMPAHLFRVDWSVDPLLPEIEGDDVQLKQVFMNLIKNAIDAMPNGGTIGIKLERAGDFVLIEISDTGVGIVPENLPQLFQLGFTTKAKGYGIGLYSIRNILNRHHGSIEGSSRPGKGTTFKIHLPITQTEQDVQNDRSL